MPLRRPPEWMASPVDERILEALESFGNLTPSVLAGWEIASRDYIQRRLSTLAEHGYVERVARGVYGITDDGRTFLAGTDSTDELPDTGREADFSE